MAAPRAGAPGAARRSHGLSARASLGRPIALLSAAAFVSVASMRVGDPLLPQVAQEFGVSAGDASVIATAFALAYGLCQLIWGALGDRFGKYRLVALMTLISALTGGGAAFAGSLATLGIARFAAGATAAAIVPLGMAFVGDHVPYRDRQAVLARFLTGTILGLVGGQVMGGAARRAGRLARGLSAARRPVPAGRLAAHGRGALAARPAAGAHHVDQPDRAAPRLHAPVRPPLGADHPRHRVRRGLPVLRRLHLHRRLSAPRVRPRLRDRRPVARLLRHRRRDLRGDRAPARWPGWASTAWRSAAAPS